MFLSPSKRGQPAALQQQPRATYSLHLAATFVSGLASAVISGHIGHSNCITSLGCPWQSIDVHHDI